MFWGEQKGTSPRCWVACAKNNGGVGCCGTGKRSSLACGALDADEHLSASFSQMPLVLLQGFGFCSESEFLCLFLELWGCAGVRGIARRAGNDLASGTANKLHFVSIALTQWGSSSDFLGLVGDTLGGVA